MCRTMHTAPNHQEQHYCNKRSECSNEKLHKLSVPGNTPCTTSAGMYALSPLVGAIILQLHHTLLQLTTCNFFFNLHMSSRTETNATEWEMFKTPATMSLPSTVVVLPKFMLCNETWELLLSEKLHETTRTTFNSSERFYPGKTPWIS